MQEPVELQLSLKGVARLTKALQDHIPVLASQQFTRIEADAGSFEEEFAQVKVVNKVIQNLPDSSTWSIIQMFHILTFGNQ